MYHTLHTSLCLASLGSEGARRRSIIGFELSRTMAFTLDIILYVANRAERYTCV